MEDVSHVSYCMVILAWSDSFTWSDSLCVEDVPHVPYCMVILAWSDSFTWGGLFPTNSHTVVLLWNDFERSMSLYQITLHLH